MASLIDWVLKYQKCSDRKAVERLAELIIGEVGPDLLRYIRSRIPKNSAKRDACEDAFQETIIGILSVIPGFRGSNEAQFRGLCYSIARFKVYDLFRGSKTSVNTIVDPEILREALNNDCVDKSISAADRLDLEAAINLIRKSSPPCVNYLWDRFVVGLPYQVMAAEYEINVDAATKRVRRCLELAKRLLKD